MPVLFVFFSASHEESTFAAANAGDRREDGEKIWIITSPILIVMFIIIISLIGRKKKVRVTISPMDIPPSLDISRENSDTLDNTYLEPIPPLPQRMLPPLPTGTSTPTSFASVRDLTSDSYFARS